MCLPIELPIAVWVAGPIEPVVVVPVELGLKAPSTGPGVTLLVPGSLTSFSGLVYAGVASGEARLLELVLLLRRCFWALNPDLV